MTQDSRFKGTFGFMFKTGTFQNQHFLTFCVPSTPNVSRNKQAQSPSQTQEFTRDCIQNSIFAQNVLYGVSDEFGTTWT